MDELAVLERETFEKETIDMNWYKGKQSQHIQSALEAERLKKTSGAVVPHFSSRKLTPVIQELPRANHVYSN